jgi:RNA polymerase sigma-70 factor, ECF subfamily
VRELDPNSLGDHLDRLYRAAWALCGSREDAEDLVQDTFAKILTRPRFLRGEEDLWYLMRTLKNVFLSQRRTLARRSPPVALDEDADPVEAPQSDRPDEAAQNREVYSAIAGLPDDMREALVAIDVVGLSYEEAAKALGVRQGTITSRLFRARARVAKSLGTGETAEPEGDGEIERRGRAR